MLGLSPPQGIRGGGGGTPGTLTIQDEGVEEATSVTTLNFEGAAISATDQGGGVVDIVVTSTSGLTEAEAITLAFIFGRTG